MERAQPEQVHTTFLERNELLHHIHYLRRIEDLFYCRMIDHSSKLALFICSFLLLIQKKLTKEKEAEAGLAMTEVRLEVLHGRAEIMLKNDVIARSEATWQSS
jgi:hypothetical protein